MKPHTLTHTHTRRHFYHVKGKYKRLLKKTETKYFENLNKDIEDGKILNQQSFKRLKKHKTDKIDFDSHDMHVFETFFTVWYTDQHTTINYEKKDTLINTADNINNTIAHPINLNEKFSTEEVRRNIRSLKTGKASSINMINNEIIKSLDDNQICFLTTFFKTCFDCGVYPWYESVIMPLHKKGNKAIAVSSVMGKLFSTISLERLIKYRKDSFPDPPNQLGFTKGARTYDHILTMNTIASKYKKTKKPVYAVFVDFKKAFDSVSRQAKFYKITQHGITGKFYNVLRDMYSNSFAYIKLSGHFSKRFKISKGTEQGHPLSPDLFKIFLSDLSKLL